MNASFDVALEGQMQGIWFWCLFGFGVGSVMVYRAQPLEARQLSPAIVMQRKMSNGNAGIPERLAQLSGLLCVLAALGLAPHPGAAAGEARGVVDVPCPRGSIEVAPGTSIQSASDAAGDNASICLKNGTHRMQVVRPRQGQSFRGEGHTILNGSRLLATLGREDKYWVANVQMRRHRRHGECASAYPTCNNRNLSSTTSRSHRC